MGRGKGPTGYNPFEPFERFADGLHLIFVFDLTRGTQWMSVICSYHAVSCAQILAALPTKWDQIPLCVLLVSELKRIAFPTIRIQTSLNSKWCANSKRAQLLWHGITYERRLHYVCALITHSTRTCSKRCVSQNQPQFSMYLLTKITLICKLLTLSSTSQHRTEWSIGDTIRGWFYIFRKRITTSTGRSQDCSTVHRNKLRSQAWARERITC